jgi:NitT/TauT family transport system substrate-binding protein
VVFNRALLLALWLVTVGCAPAAPERAAPTGPGPAPGAAQAAVPPSAPAPSLPPTSAPATTAAAPFPPPGVAKPATPDAVRLGFIGTASDSGVVLAIERGYFTAVGIAVETVPFSTAAEMVAPLGAGQLDVGGGSPGAGLNNAVARGIALKLVADKGNTSPGHGFEALLVRKDLWDSGQVRGLADFPGRRLGTPTTAGVGANVVFDRAMRSVGRGVQDVEIAELSQPDILSALANGSVELGQLLEPFATRAVAGGYAVILARDDEIYPNHQLATLLYSAAFGQERPDTARRFMLAYVQGLRDYNRAFFGGDAARREAVLPTLMEYTKLTDRSIWDQMVLPGLNPDCRLFGDTLAEDQDYYLAAGLQREPIDLPALIDHQYCDYAVQQLGPYR